MLRSLRAVLSRRVLPFAGLLMVSALLHSTTASGRARLLEVEQRDALTFQLPSTFRKVPLTEGALASAQLEHAYADVGTPPLQVLVTRDAAQQARTLPYPSAEVTRDYAAGFTNGIAQHMRSAEVYEVSGSTYDPERAVFVVMFKTRTSPRAGSVPSSSALASIAFFTRTALVQVFVIGPESRAQEVHATAKQIVSSSVIGAQNKPRASWLHELEDLSAFGLGRLVGAVLGPIIVVFLVGRLLALALTRFGTAPDIAAMVCCGLLIVTAVVGALVSDGVSIFSLLQLGSYTLSSVVAVRPLTRWLKSRPRPAAT
jgi:hypothetical protein